MSDLILAVRVVVLCLGPMQGMWELQAVIDRVMSFLVCRHHTLTFYVSPLLYEYAYAGVKTGEDFFRTANEPTGNKLHDGVGDSSTESGSKSERKNKTATPFTFHL